MPSSRMAEALALDKLKVSEEEPPTFETPILSCASEADQTQLSVNVEEALRKANELKMEGNALFASHQYSEAAGFDAGDMLPETQCLTLLALMQRSILKQYKLVLKATRNLRHFTIIGQRVTSSSGTMPQLLLTVRQR